MQKESKWKSSDEISVLFLDDDQEKIELFEMAISQWQKYINLKITLYYSKRELSSRKNVIRVSFNEKEGRNYSAIGTGFNDGFFVKKRLNIAEVKENKIKFYQTSLHEFGHALGLLHEHQHPNAYDGVSDDQLKKICSMMYFIDVNDEHELGRCLYNIAPLEHNKKKYSISEYDVYSVMHYENAARKSEFPEPKHAMGLSLEDKTFIANEYPKEQPLDNEEIELMHNQDREEDLRWILETYQSENCKLERVDDKLYLTKVSYEKSKTVRIPSFSHLDSWFDACKRATSN
ncbi:M12 family metallopeptidase [Halobacteriovorax sp. GB3]|uniref:M12 family metallopeptidase n=1 Tax=Halobacteriovorax sp. GB3 TaxID=2719615 RepID=UPI00235ED702|nr:M12 family metallopeptidase [Halobacteriovorax sp. GB3]MDD0852157.1 M12 family metallopeptidase [Halobacteriovorax sp. GB3]